MEKVKISIGKTYNTGNYTSVRLDVGRELEAEMVNEEDFEELIADVENTLAKLEAKKGLK